MSPVIEIKYVEPVFTLMTRATSNLPNAWEGCYFTYIGCIEQLLYMHPAYSGLSDELESDSLLQALLYLVLIQMTLHPLVEYCTLTLWIQTVSPLPCGEAQYASVNFDGLLQSSLPLAKL